ncbi:GTP-binding protein [Inconstantimicrobium mannanitabidum]|uniref:Cobalamin biosynthesis protein CobW n=1 Tax=Inconstantimicrobium mannanitabidum TaxID=1604901 RepID=A0ACB5RFM5_9CLOT|nr:GTP-binding protein [Clostridium sp. TW13]GKX67888.1 cobalamin biosynthesis protein CobW [Clostridium sp. TW13]
MYTKIDIISGFLGAGKTTLIKKVIEEKLKSEKVAIVENEFGEIGIDGSILRTKGIEVQELNSGCICCSLTGDFDLALKEIIKDYKPDRIIIEPSGVANLSDVLNVCRKMTKQDIVKINMCIVVVDAVKYQMYLRNFSEFFINQIKNAKTVILSRTQNIEPDKLVLVVKDIQKINCNANIITTPWNQLPTSSIISVGEQSRENLLENKINIVNIEKQVYNLKGKEQNKVLLQCGKAHTASEVFQVWGTETPKIFSKNQIIKLKDILSSSKFGAILRAKGIVRIENNKWIQFDFVPNEIQVNSVECDYTGRICVIGADIDRKELEELFNNL